MSTRVKVSLSLPSPSYRDPVQSLLLAHPFALTIKCQIRVLILSRPPYLSSRFHHSGLLLNHFRFSSIQISSCSTQSKSILVSPTPTSPACPAPWVATTALLMLFGCGGRVYNSETCHRGGITPTRPGAFFRRPVPTPRSSTVYAPHNIP